MPRDVSLVQNSRGEFMLCILVDPSEAADEDTTLVQDPEVHVEPHRLLVIRGGKLAPLAAPRPDDRMLADMVRLGHVLVAEVAKSGRPLSAYHAVALLAPSDRQ